MSSFAKNRTIWILKESRNAVVKVNAALEIIPRALPSGPDEFLIHECGVPDGEHYGLLSVVGRWLVPLQCPMRCPRHRNALVLRFVEQSRAVQGEDSSSLESLVRTAVRSRRDALICASMSGSNERSSRMSTSSTSMSDESAMTRLAFPRLRV